MTQASEILSAGRAPQIRVVGVVSAAHFVSHYYMLLLAPLIPIVRADFGVSYTEIGLALAAFNIASSVLQTPTGFLVDWLGARILLIAGLLIGACAFIIAGLAHSYWVLVAMFALAGVGNTVYHPADYAMLSQHVKSKYIGQAFSVHTFAGMLGSAVAPMTVLTLQGLWGWRAAFIAAGILGLVVALALVITRDIATAVTPAPPRATADTGTASWRLLLSAPILLSLAFFILQAVATSGLFNYSVVALGALYHTPLSFANTALTGHLLLLAVGVLVGGLMVARTTRHAAVTAVGLVLMTGATALIAVVDLGTLGQVAAMAAAGFFYGVIMPSRDMIVRDATPPGSFGKVFGFVTTGFSIGGGIGPLIFGALMDHGSPRLVFLGVAACSLLAVLTVVQRPRRAVAPLA